MAKLPEKGNGVNDIFFVVLQYLMSNMLNAYLLYDHDILFPEIL